VLILSLALVVLPTSLDNRSNTQENTQEIISLLNRSNELSREQTGRVLSDKKLSHPKSRTMVGEDHDDMDEDDIMDVRELIGQMKTLLRNKRKRNEVVGMVKRGRFEMSDKRGGGLSGLLGVMKHGVGDQDNSGGWWVSSDEEEELIGGKNRGRVNYGGRFGGDKRGHAFQIVDDVEVD